MKSNPTVLNQMYQCLTSSGAWMDGSILPKHEREQDESYNRRKQGFCSSGLYSYLINTYSLLFAKAPTRIGIEDSDPYGLFIDDCGYGMDLNSFMDYNLRLSACLGSVAILMDADAEQPASLEGMKLARSFPFLQTILPQNITVLVVDKVGRLLEFGYQYFDTLDVNQGTRKEKVYKKGTIETFEYKADPKDSKKTVRVSVDTQSTGIDIIPVIMMVPSREPLVTSQVPSSPTFDLYKQQYNIAVTNSLMDESLYAQQFSVLTIIGDVDISKITLGVNNALCLPTNTQASFISPSGTPVDLMIKRNEATTTSMIRTFANMLTNGTAQSGEAKVIDRQVGALQLKNISNYLEQIEYKIYEMFNLFMGKDVIETGYEYTVKYFKDFDLTDIGGYIAQAGEVLSLDITDEAKAQIKASVLRKFFSGEDPAKIAEMVENEEKNITVKEPEDEPGAKEENANQEDANS